MNIDRSQVLVPIIGTSCAGKPRIPWKGSGARSHIDDATLAVDVFGSGLRVKNNPLVFTSNARFLIRFRYIGNRYAHDFNAGVRDDDVYAGHIAR